jgi:hypothetical protein
MTDEARLTAATEIAHRFSPTRGEAFRRELRDLLNRFSMENGSNTPDYILADYLIDCLKAWNRAVNERGRSSE